MTKGQEMATIMVEFTCAACFFFVIHLFLLLFTHIMVSGGQGYYRVFTLL